MSGVVWAGRFLRDRRGVASLEFALVAPIMITLLFGTVEIANAFRVQAKLNTAAGQLAELVAAQASVTAPNGSLADVCLGAGLNLAPFDQTMFTANIVSISNDHPSNRVARSTDSTTVSTYLDWENRSDCAAPSATAVGLTGAFNVANRPASMLTKTATPAASTTDATLAYGYSAVVVKASYSYRNLLSFTLGSSMTFSAVAVARPRTNVTIKCTDSAGTTPCPALQ